VGDVVYGKVIDLPKDFPMEVTCVHSSGKALGLGSLEGGNIFHVPVHFTRILRSPNEKDNILKKIGKIVPCETAVGVNGLVWVRAKSAVLTVLVSQLIQNLAKYNADEYEMLLKQFRKGLNGLTN
jgi:exosome complex component RRP40